MHKLLAVSALIVLFSQQAHSAADQCDSLNQNCPTVTNNVTAGLLSLGLSCFQGRLDEDYHEIDDCFAQLGEEVWNGIKWAGKTFWNGIKSTGKAIWEGLKVIHKPWCWFGGCGGGPDPAAVKAAQELSRLVKDNLAIRDKAQDFRNNLERNLPEANKLKADLEKQANHLGSEFINGQWANELESLVNALPSSQTTPLPDQGAFAIPDLAHHDSNSFQTLEAMAEWEKLVSVQRYRRSAAKIIGQVDVYHQMAGLAIHAADVSYTAGNTTRGDTILETASSLIDTAIHHDDPPLTGPDSRSISPSTLQPGDLILSTEDDLDSGLIRDFSTLLGSPPSPFSHVSLYIGEGKVVEAIPNNGVVFRSLQDALNKASLATVYRHKDMTPLDAFAAVIFAVSYEGADYDYIGAATSASMLLCGIGFSSKYSCSELVVEAINSTGFDIVSMSPDCSTPHDVFMAIFTGKTEYIGHIVTSDSQIHDLSVPTQQTITTEYVNNVSFDSLFSDPVCIPRS